MRVEMTIFVAGVNVAIDTDVDLQRWLDALIVRAVRRRARALLRNGGAANLQSAITDFIANLTAEDLRNIAEYDDEVEIEAIALAEAEITAQLAREGLPPPRNLREHAQALIVANGSFLERARKRLTAKAEIASEIMSQDAVEVEL